LIVASSWVFYLTVNTVKCSW